MFYPRVFQLKLVLILGFIGLATVSAPVIAVSDQESLVVINEFLASNGANMADEDGDNEDWIELYNPTAQPISLKNYTLTDKPENTDKWTFPEITVSPEGFLLLWASGKDRSKPGNWNFEKPLELTFKSAGYSDGDFASILVNDEEKSLNRRGINIVRLDEEGNYVETTVYDTWESPDAADSLVRYLNKLSKGDIVVFSIRDEGSANLSAKARLAIEKRGSEFIGQLSYWDSWGMVVIAGQGKILEDYRSSGKGIASGSLVSNLNLHTNFRLNKDEEYLGLYAPDGTVVSSISFRDQVRDVSFGRNPDGGKDWCYFSKPTPKGPNSSDCATGITATPEPSAGRGFYREPVKVKITSPDESNVHYTLDGSIPTELSPPYNEPLTFEETGVLRVRAFQGGLIPSQTVTSTFFIEEGPRLPVLSLVTDPANLWNEDTGIYATGRYSVHPNYLQRGEDWERPVFIEFYEEDGSLGFTANGGIRIHGGCTRTFPKKSFLIFFSKSYGEAELHYPVFTEARFAKSDLTGFKNLILRNIGNDGYGGRPRIRDSLIHALWAEQGGLISAKRSVFVYINGEPWGIYNIREHIDKHYLASNFGLSDVDLIEAMAVREGDAAHWHEMLNFFESSDLRNDGTYARAGELINIDNFTDFWIFQIYAGNIDLDGNLKVFRARTTEGKWHWIMWDLDLALGLSREETPVTHNTLVWHTRRTHRPDYGHDWADGDLRIPMMLSKLLENEEYRNYFINRFEDLLNTTLHPDNVIATIDALVSIIEPDLPLEMERWSSDWGGSLEEWTANLDELRDFARLRPAELRLHIINYFGLTDMVHLKVQQPESGNGIVRLNTVLLERYPWQGTYFRGIPVNLEAKPAPGYKFAGWNDPSLPKAQKITILPSEGSVIQALFSPAN